MWWGGALSLVCGVLEDPLWNYRLAVRAECTLQNFLWFVFPPAICRSFPPMLNLSSDRMFIVEMHCELYSDSFEAVRQMEDTPRTRSHSSGTMTRWFYVRLVLPNVLKNWSNKLKLLNNKCKHQVVDQLVLAHRMFSKGNSSSSNGTPASGAIVHPLRNIYVRTLLRVEKVVLVVFSLYPVGCFGFANSVPQEIRLLIMRA